MLRQEHSLGFRFTHPSSFLFLLFLCSPCWSQPSRVASSLNSGGGYLSGGSIYRMRTTIGQSGVIGISQWGTAGYEIAWGFQTPEPFLGEAPSIISATVSDADNDGIIETGDLMVLTMDRSVVVTTKVLQASHFFLPVAGDALGRTNFAVQVNPHNSRQIVLTLGGPAVHLVTTGTFSMQYRTPNSPSGIDFASSLPLGAIVSLDGIAATDGGVQGVDDSGVDIEISLQGRSATIGRSGGTLRVGPSPNAAYKYHEVVFPSDPQRTTMTIELRPPVRNLGVIGAIQIKSNVPRPTFPKPVTIRLQYREGDIDWERGQLESSMRVHQLVEKPLTKFHWEPVPGSQTLSGGPPLVPFHATKKFDATPRLTSVSVTSLNPCGTSGTIGIFAGLPIETVDERTINIKSGSGGGIVRDAGLAVLMPGSRGVYTLHKLEIPGYVTTSVTDPQRLVVKVRTATLAERYSQTSGQSFPAQSGAVFTVTVTNASDQPVPFTSPVHMTVQFIDRPNPALTDLVHFNGQLAPAANMRLVRDQVDGEAVDFGFVGAPSQTVNPVEGTVTVLNYVGLTGMDGCGTFGAVGMEAPPPTRAARWEIYP